MAEDRSRSKQRRLEMMLLGWLGRAFESAGWQVEKQSSRPRSPDLLCRDDEHLYAVELRALDGAARLSRLQALLADAILRARAAARQHGALPLAVVAAERLSRRMLAGLEAYVGEFAEDVAWGAMDQRGLLELHGPGLEDVHSVTPVEPIAERAARRVEAPDPFSDLGQWMIKVLLARRVPGEWLDAPRGPVRSVGELAEKARISAASASRLLSALRGRGFVDDPDGALRLVRVPALLASWRAVSLKPNQELHARFLFPAADPAERLEKLIAGRPAGRRAGQRICLGLFSACKVLGLGWVRGAPLHLYSEDLSTPFLRDIGLHPVDPAAESDLIVRRPRYPESVFRGAISVEGIAVADVLQCWLDVSAHPARGAEQAQEILDRIGLLEDGRDG